MTDYLLVPLFFPLWPFLAWMTKITVNLIFRALFSKLCCHCSGGGHTQALAEDGQNEGLQPVEVDSEQQEQQVDREFREEGEKESKGGEEEELAPHPRKPDIRAHRLSCQGLIRHLHRIDM